MTLRSLTTFCLLVAAPVAAAQSQSSLPDLVAQAIAASPAVAAERFRVQQAQSAASAEASPSNTTLEVAPGVGFTNSNFSVGQTFDLSGRRAARVRRSQAETQVAAAGLLRAQSAVAEAFLASFAEFLASREMAAYADAGVEGAANTLAALRKRVEIGEAPAVHQTRAELELARSEQAQTLARRRSLSTLLKLQSMLGREGPFEMPWLTPNPEAGVGVRAELLETQARLEVARAGVLEASRLGRPSLFAGIATDTWSLDRRSSQGNNVGFQLQMSMPLWDRGENRHARSASEAAVRAREAELLDVERWIGLERDTALLDLTAFRQAAEGYQGGIVPKAQQMVRAMRAGMEAGLTSFLEVLEAQKALNDLQREAAEATLALRLAEVQHLAAWGRLPGVGVKN